MQNAKWFDEKNLKLLLKGEARPLTLTAGGFGMLEMVIAVGVMIVILGASAILQKNAIKNTVISSERAQAYNLAREGIEAVRAIRDSKWLDQVVNEWNDGLTSGINYDVTLDSNGYWQLNSAPAPIQLGYYNQNGDQIITSQQFTRSVLFDPISDNLLNNIRDIVNRNNITVYSLDDLRAKTIRVSVQVSWESYGVNRNVTAYEYLTDWKPMQ